MKIKVASLLIALCMFMATGSKAIAGSHAGQKKFVSIPVMYVTDRAATKKGYGSQRKFESIESIDDMHFGWLNYSLPTDQDITSQQTKLGWSESTNHQKLTTKGLSDVHTYDEFGKIVADAAKNAETDEIFVFVHGFNTPFASAAREAATLSHAVQRPVILYSWPSKGRLTQYNVDLGNNEWSQEHFNELMLQLKQLQDTSGLKFNLLAHSMGNRLAVRSAPILKGRHVFKQIFLVDPDFDAETFVHYLVRYVRGENDQPLEERTKVRILFSHKDHALPMSEFLFGGYTRLGQAADTLLSSVVTPYAIPRKLSDALTKSEESKEVKNDGTPNWLVNFEWIDFTVLDHGIIGHTIPYKLVADLWSTNQPGEGLKLVHSDNGAPNRLARIFLRVFGETEHISSEINTCERVIRTGSKHDRESLSAVKETDTTR